LKDPIFLFLQTQKKESRQSFPIGKLLTIKNCPTTMKQSTNPRNKQIRNNNNNKRDYDTLYLSPVSLLNQGSKSPTKTTKKERKRRGVYIQLQSN